MGEPRAIAYKEVQKGYKSDSEANEAWRKIGDITGAGHIPPSDEASIDITDLSDSKRDRVEKLLTPEAEVVIDEKKRGNK